MNGTVGPEMIFVSGAVRSQMPLRHLVFGTVKRQKLLQKFSRKI